MISWECLLALSEACLRSIATPGDEAERQFNETLARASISRSYYAAYHAGLQFAVAKGFSKKYRFKTKIRGGCHERLWAWFDENGFPDDAIVGNSLKKRRHIADYKLGYPTLPNPGVAFHEAEDFCYKLHPPTTQPAQLKLIP